MARLSPSDFSGTSTGSGDVSVGDLPTTVPTSFYAQAQGDMLNQQAAADQAATQFQTQVLNDHLNTTAAIQQLDQGSKVIGKANQYIGSTAWGSGHNTYCETFAEQMTDGQNMGPSAIAAFGNRLKSGQGVADPSLQGIQPGDLVYFGSAGENGGYGHVGVYTGSGRITSATVNGIQNYPISAFNAPVVGYARTGSPGANTETGTAQPAGAAPPPIPSSDKVEGGDNPPPPDFSGGSWAPPSLDSFKNWLGSVTDRIMSGADQLGTDIHNAPGPIGQLAGAAGDVANDLAVKPGGSPVDALTGPLRAVGQIGSDLANIPSALNADVANAEGIQPKPLPSIPVLSGAADLATGLMAPGGIESRSPGALGGDVLSQARLDAQGIPGMAGASDTAAQMDQVAQQGGQSGFFSNALDQIKKAALSKVDPAALTPSSMQDRIAQYANDMLYADQRGETAMREARDLLPDLNINDAIDYERTGNFLPNMSPEEQAANDAITSRLQSTGDMLKQRGLVTEDVTQQPGGPNFYFPHLLNGSEGYEDVVGRGSFNPKDYFSRQREFPDLAQAYQAGYDLKSSVPEVLGEHESSAYQAAARQDFLDGVKNDPAVALPTDQAPRDWINGSKLDPMLMGYAVEPNSAKAMNNLLTHTPSTLFGDANNLLKESNLALSGFHAAAEARRAWHLTLISGQPQQYLPIMGQAIKNLVSDGAYQDFYMKNPQLFEGAAQTGTTMLSHGRSPDLGPVGLGSVPKMIARGLVGAATGGISGNAYAQKNDQDNVVRDTLAGAVAGAGANVTLTPAMNQALFQRFIPTLKVMTQDVASSAFGPDAASKLVNDAFGGQNLAAVARDPGFQRLLHATVLAPDWNESFARMMGRAVTSGPSGEAARKYWVSTMTSALLGIEGMNLVLTGHLTVDSPMFGKGNDPGRELQVDMTPALQKIGVNTGGQQAYIDTFPIGQVSGIERAISNRDPGSLASSRLSVPLKIGGSLWANEDFRGKHIVPPGTPFNEAVGPEAAYAITQDIPIGEQTFGNDKLSPAEKAISLLSGMRIGHGPAWQPGFTAPRSSGGYSGYGGYGGYGSGFRVRSR